MKNIRENWNGYVPTNWTTNWKEEMGKFLDIQPVKTDLRSNLNKLITRSEIESVMKNLPAKKCAILDGFPGVVYQTYKETLTPSLLRLFQDKEEEQTLPNSFCEGNITLFPKQRHTNKKRKKENYRPMSIMNIDAKFLNKILANQVQQDIKRIIYHDQAGFILWSKDGSTYANQSYDESICDTPY